MGFGQREGLGTGRIACVGVLLAAAVFFAGAAAVIRPSLPEAQEPQTMEPPTASVTADRDKGRAVKLLQEDGTVVETTMADYLFGVVAAEMPAAFEEEALKAQACAARTYTVVRQASAHAAHPQADVCTDSGCCQAYVERQAAETRWGISAGT